MAFGAGVAMAGATVAQIAPDPTAGNEVASKLDPQGYSFVQPVCTRCHNAETFLHSRRWSDWQRTLGRMAANGAAATADQWVPIQAYFKRNLTLLYVNNADEDELTTVLGVDEKTAIAIVQRRVDRRFENAADLESVPGVDRALIESMKPRLLFAAPQGSG